MIKNKCKNYKQHTPCPKTYMEWTSWADNMKKNGYKQYQCHECGRYEIWILNKKSKLKSNNLFSSRKKNNFWNK